MPHPADRPLLPASVLARLAADGAWLLAGAAPPAARIHRLPARPRFSRRPA